MDTFVVSADGVAETREQVKAVNENSTDKKIESAMSHLQIMLRQRELKKVMHIFQEVEKGSIPVKKMDEYHVQITRYLLSVILLKAQTPHIAVDFLVGDFLNGKKTESGYYYTLQRRNSAFCLTENEKRLFMKYLTFFHNRTKNAINYYFITTRGNPVNAVCEVSRYLNVLTMDASISPSVVKHFLLKRLHFTVSQTTNISEEDMNLFLTGKKLPDDKLMEICSLLNNLVPEIQESCTDESGIDCYSKLISKYPVSCDAKMPTKVQVDEILDENDESQGITYVKLQNKWRHQQQEMRIQNAIHSCRRFKPGDVSHEVVAKMIKKEEWQLTPTATARLLQRVKDQQPINEKRGKVNIISDDEICRRIEEQNWPGLTVVYGIPGIGKAIFANRRFDKGIVICNYNGILMSREKGLKLYQGQGENEMGYRLFFKHDSKSYCIDATRDDNTLGRLINHSKLHPNIRGEAHVLCGNLCVVFITICEIRTGDQLLYDYGAVARKESSSVLQWMSGCPGCRYCNLNT